VGKAFHLPSLLLILVFGIMIGNTEKIITGKALKYLNPEKLKLDLLPFKHLTEETAFVIRTFFFVLFGYNVDLKELVKPEIIFSGLTIVGISLVIRYVYLRFTVMGVDRLVKLFLAPRGLITVILFYSIPAKYIIPEFSIGIIFFVIIVTGFMMTISLWLGNKNENNIFLENENNI
jgi:NhaP-type Na+/H+ or K+/H+ antiporter